MFKRYNRFYAVVVLLTFLLILSTILPGLQRYLSNQTVLVSLDESNNHYYRADKSIVLFPFECVNFSWSVENISSIYFNGAGSSGQGNQDSCFNWPAERNLLINYPDGSQSNHTIRIELAFPYPLIAIALLPLLLISLYFIGRNWAENNYPISSKLESSKQGETLAYVPELDGLRALALIMVFMSHFLASQRPEEIFWDRLSVIHWGRIGVVHFFLLSGFLITSILLSNRKKVQEMTPLKWGILKAFYARRFLRIFPVYYLSIVVLFMAGIPDVQASLFWLLTYTANIGQGFFNVNLGITSHFWSLAVEEQFYMVFPVAALFLSQKRLKYFLYGAILGSMAYKFFGWYLGVSWEGLGFMLFSSMDSLAFGALYALFLHNPKEYETEAKILLGVSALIGPLLLVILQLWKFFWLRGKFHHEPAYVALIDLAISLSSLALIHLINVRKTGLGGWFLRWSPLRYIGKISYSAYVYHHFFLLLGLHETMPVYQSFLIYSFGSLGLASFSWHVFESPINDLKDRFPYLKKPEKSTEVEIVP